MLGVCSREGKKQAREMKGLGKIVIWSKVYMWPADVRTLNGELPLRAVFPLGLATHRPWAAQGRLAITLQER